MKRIISAILSLLILFSLAPLTVYAENTPAVRAESYVLMDRETGKVLAEKNAHEKLFPASTTKNLTALLALENLNLDDAVTMGDELDLVEKDGSVGGLLKGERISFRELIWALMLPSGNDAAYVLAVQTARKKSGKASMSTSDAVKYFADMMNKRAAQLGAKESHFANPDGYNDPEHYSTSYDLALIAREAMKNKFFREVVGTHVYTIKEIAALKPGSPENKGGKWVNRNELLNQQGKYYYPYADGIKTGHTSQAGYCLSSSAVKDGFGLIAVVLKDVSEDARCLDTKAIFEYGFSNFKFNSFAKKGQTFAELEVLRKFSDKPVAVKVLASKDCFDVMSNDDSAGIKQSYEWGAGVKASDGDKSVVSLKAPVREGQVLGKVKFMLGDTVVAETELVAGQTVKDSKLWDAVPYFAGRVYAERVPIIISVIIAAAVIIAFSIFRKRRR